MVVIVVAIVAVVVVVVVIVVVVVVVVVIVDVVLIFVAQSRVRCGLPPTVDTNAPMLLVTNPAANRR